MTLKRRHKSAVRSLAWLTVVALSATAGLAQELVLIRNGRLYEEATSQSVRIRVLHPPEIVTRLPGAITNNYINVRTNRNEDGWVYRHYLTDAPQPAVPPVAAAPNPNELTFASWNVRILSNGSRTDAELGIIALILFRYDFIALQEVRDQQVIERLQTIPANDFQANYDIEVSEPVGRTTTERYAFMWNSDRIEQVGTGSFYADPGDGFIREPFCGSFRTGTFDWTMCTVHILFGNNQAERRPELLLLDDVYRSVRDSGAGNDVIICGDFNFPPDDVGWNQLLQEDSMQFAIAQPARTTIADVSLYDNCWWPAATSEIVAGSAHVFEFDELMYPEGSRQEANRLTSDHRPISVRVLPAATDDD